MLDRNTFYSNASELVTTFNDFVRKHSLVGVATADHLCFKCDSKETFEQVREMLEPESNFMYQSYISGRRIAVIKLKKDFETELGPISTLELSDQKPDKSQITRFDHIEICPINIEYDDLAKKIQEEGTDIMKVERPHHTTYDIPLDNGYQLKLTREFLIEKIKRDEMI